MNVSSPAQIGRGFATFCLVAGLFMGACGASALAARSASAGEPAARQVLDEIRGLRSKEADFYVLHTALSPASLYAGKKGYLAFFADMATSGLGGPTFAAYAASGSARIVRAGEPMTPADMSENWILVWFAGARGWTDWDSPWAVFLQRKPKAMSLGEGGLALEFFGPAGSAVLMPLYGYYKPPQEGKDYLAQHGLPSKGIRTWEWSRGLPAGVLERVRYWSKVSREFPIGCRETFSVDRAKDAITIRSRMEWLSIDDDWKTPHVKLAPVSPALAHAAMDGRFPVRFSGPLKDPQLFTPYGPYMGVEGADEYDAVLAVLKYVNETEAPDPPNVAAHPTVRQALERLQAAARGKFRSGDKYDYDHGGLNNFCWAIQGDQWYAKGIPHYQPETQEIAKASLGKYFRDDVLVAERYKERIWPRGSGQSWLILEGPGIGSWNELGDAGKFSSNLMETLWAYGHFTGDWEVIKQRWDMVKRLFCMPAECSWVTFGRFAIAEMGDEAAMPLAYARMAYRVGDMDGYGWGCYIFARELVHHWLKQRGSRYFRLNQPWHSLEFMPEEVYLTNLWGDVAAWQIDGPTYPAKTGERQYTNRWVRFKNEDVARFYRDFLAEDVRGEMDLLTARWPERRRFVNDSHIMPSLVQLRSLLLNEPPAELARLATPDRFGGPPSGVIASCMSVLRTSRPIRFQRIIPPAAPTPFALGLERIPGRFSALTHMIDTARRDRKARQETPAWPLVRWWGWKTPTGENWNFGRVMPTAQGPPPAARRADLNWTTTVATYQLGRSEGQR